MPKDAAPIAGNNMSGEDSRDDLLRMRGINKSFPGVVALNNVDFTLKKGEVHVLMGANGAGKSTLVKVLSGAYRKDAGEIWLAGKDVEYFDTRQARELGIAIIYQTFSQVLHLSIMENLFLGREKTKYGLVDFKQMRSDAEAAIMRIGLSVDVSTLISDLGIAQRQMVEIAKALSLDAKVVIMDEPTSALTRKETEMLFSLIRGLKARGIGIIYISHRIDELRQIGDRVTVMRDGKIVGTHRIDDVKTSELITMMVGKNSENFSGAKHAALSAGRVCLRVSGFSKEKAFQGISFQLHEGEILGMFGLMGAGCTEMARSIFGVDRYEAGEVFVRGEIASIQGPADAMKYGIGFLPEDRQDSGLALSMSVGHNISLSSIGNFRDTAGLLNLGEENKQIAAWISELGIKTPTPKQQVQLLSGGNQQKAVFAKWLMANSSILLLDEPTQGIDVVAKSEVHRLIHTFTREKHGAVLMISSELPELLENCDRILVIYQGQIKADLTAANANQELLMSYALGMDEQDKGKQ
jgi:ribose transport system ATP-binding protein